MHSQKSDKINEICIEFYDILDKIHNHEISEVFVYLNRHIDPSITTAISDAKFPGLKQKIILKLEGCIGYKFITNFQDKNIGLEYFQGEILSSFLAENCFRLFVTISIFNIASFYNKAKSASLKVLYRSLCLAFKVSSYHIGSEKAGIWKYR